MKDIILIAIITVVLFNKTHDDANQPLEKDVLLMSEISNYNSNVLVSKNLEKKAQENVTVQVFGKVGTEDIFLYTLTNENGYSATITNYGGIITSLNVPDKNGVVENIVLGYDTLNEYLENPSYIGAIIGRYSNRIAKGKFLIESTEYQLSKNENENHIHGGVKGFNQVVWNATPNVGEDYVGLDLFYLSKDKEEGYPGNLSVKVRYKLTNSNEFQIEYFATTDKKTIVNLTQHSFFNLSGNVKTNVLDHELKINADYFLPINNNLIPKGVLQTVKNTPFDFNEFTKIGKRINSDNEQLKVANGYDHTYVLKNKDEKLDAIVYDEISGRKMELTTTKSGVQLYTGNFLSKATKNEYGSKYENRSGFCLETQLFPNAPNEPSFPSGILFPNEEYHELTIFKFSIKTD